MIPDIATVGEYVGGAHDGERIAVIDGRDCAAMIVLYEKDGALVGDLKVNGLSHSQMASALRTLATSLDGVPQ